MTQDGIRRRELLKAGLAGALMLEASAVGQAVGRAEADRADVPDDEFLQVAPDHWSFETAKTHRRFIPFGANLVLTSKKDLNLFGPRYGSQRYDRILAACEKLHVNLLKVFLPVGSLLPDPQSPGEARIVSGYLDNLDDFLRLCRKRHIRAVLCLSEWGVAGCRWWQEGGRYFGRRPWKTDPGIDSLDILTHFWAILATRVRENPAVFSYTPCAEWSMPSGNMTPPWAPPKNDIGLVPGDVALWYWRRWLRTKYSSLDALNHAWGTAYRDFDDLTIVNYAYDFTTHRYADPERKILDYQNFREWATLRYFRPQIAAIRAADSNHMVTISNHMRSWNLWEGAASHFLGYTPSEETPLVDYMTHHANYDENELKDGRTLETIVREVEVMVRFAHAGKPMPLILEEFTFSAADPKRTAEGEAAIVRGTVGHASGWTTWYLQYPEGAGAADTAHRMAWLNDDLSPTPWGETARALFGELRRGDLRRKPARRTVRLDRAVELVPKKTGVLITTSLEYERFEQPTDYVVAHEKDLDIRLEGDPVSPKNALRCAPVISGALRWYNPAESTKWSADGWRREMDDERALGFNLLWLSNIPAALASGGTGDPLKVLLDLCAERNVQVILDTGSTGDWVAKLDAAAQRKVVGGWIREIAARYGSHPAFYAWYVPHEIYVVWDRFGDYINEVYPALVQMCKKATPGKPVTLSPFFILDTEKVFGDFRYATPEEYEQFWTGLIRRSGFDIIMLQDSGEHFSYVTNQQRRPFFAAMQSACKAGGAKLWGNVETAEFECPSIEQYVRRYGRVHHSTVKDAPWRAVPMDRLEDKLRLAAEYAERIVCWGYCQFGRPPIGPKAAAWHRDYRLYHRRIAEKT